MQVSYSRNNNALHGAHVSGRSHTACGNCTVLPSCMGKPLSHYSKPLLVGINVDMRRPPGLSDDSDSSKRKKINDINSAHRVK
jgi:hypothetical protein